ncbi:MAG: hypothetical protein IKE94_05545 [Aeriscardovia sp.]|nr:hypothetical protein [Aeriscardovia sp.]MBR6843455.1 hypothetical protein [Prevotella sp.]
MSEEKAVRRDAECRVRHAFNQGYEMGLKENKKQSGDAISRQAAIVQLSHNKNGDDDCDVIIQRDVETIKALPSVTPQQRTGRWIDSHIPESMLCECSECGFTCGAYSFNYCPNCGCSMKGELE